jgi:NTE family protein
VAGAGARGAYEAGALSELLPRMAAADQCPTVLVGTSAGALNVVALAALAHLPAGQATGRLTDAWASMQLQDVFSMTSGLDTGLRYIGQLLGLPMRLPSVLDTRRLRKRLNHMLPWESLHRNIADGRVDAVAVTTTSVTTGGTVVFVEKNPSIPLPENDVGRNITYVETQLDVEHVVASTAVPIIFRPVRISTPGRWRGWYVDGGLRLNTPLAPAIAFGCSRLGVVATQPMTSTTSPPPRAYQRAAGEPPTDGPQPDLYSVVALALRVLLADRMVEGLHRLSERTFPGFPGHRVDVLFTGPPADRRGDISALADAAFHHRYAGLGAARNPSMWMLDRLIGGDPDDHGNLLSYLFFDPAFTGPVAELGRMHARWQLSQQGER